MVRRNHTIRKLLHIILSVNYFIISIKVLTALNISIKLCIFINIEHNNTCVKLQNKKLGQHKVNGILLQQNLK